MSASLDPRFAELNSKTIAVAAEKAISDFYKLSNSEQDNKRTNLTKSFLANGFEGMSRDDILQFFEEFKRDKLGIPVTSENMEKMAQMLGKMPKSEDRAGFSHGKAEVGLETTKFVHKRVLKNLSRVLRRRVRKNEYAAAKLDIQYHGKTSFSGNRFQNWNLKRKSNRKANKDKKIEAKINKKEALIIKLENKIAGTSKWNYKTWLPRIRLNIANKRYEYLHKRKIDRMTINANTQNSQIINSKLQELQKQRASGLSKDRLSYIDKKIQMYSRLSEYSANQTQSKQTEYDNKQKSIAQTKENTEGPLCEKIAKHYESFSHKEDMLDYSTTTGQWMYAILEKSSENKKHLESIYLERKHEEFANSDDFFKTLKEQVGEKNAKMVLYALDHEDPLRKMRNDRKQADNQQENTENQDTGNVNENQTDRPANPARPTTEINMQNLNESYYEAGYSEIYLAFPPDMTKDEKLDYLSHNSRFKKNNGDTLYISRPDADTYTMSARDNNNENTVPSVKDMVLLISTLQKDGHKSMELGHVESPEFLARMMVAAEQAGMEISNLAEKKKEMEDRGLYQDVEKEITRIKNPEQKEVVIEENQPKGQEKQERSPEQQPESRVPDQQTEKGLDAKELLQYNSDLAVDIRESNPKGVEHFINGMEALSVIQNPDMSPEKYEEFKQGNTYQKLTSKQKNILDATHKLQQSAKEGKIGDKDKAYLATMGRLAESYKKTLDNAKNHEHKRGKDGVTRAKETFAKRAITQVARASSELNR